MTLGTLFSGNLFLDSAINTVQERSKGKNYDALEKRLKNIFYPETKSKNYFKDAQEKILKEEAQFLEETIIRNIDTIINGKNINIDNNIKKININTIKTAILRAENVIHSIPQKINNTNKMEEALSSLNNIINDTNNLISGYKTTDIISKVDSNFDALYKALNQLRGISSLTGLDNYNQNKGLLLEEIFGGSSGTRSDNFNKFVDSINKELIEAGIEGLRTGQMVQARGNVGTVQLAKFDIEKKKNNESKFTQINKKIKFDSLGDIASTIDYDATQKKQIKMDVEIKFKPGEGVPEETFRASLKNWGGIDKKSLGKTSILGAILRTSGSTVSAKAYSLSLLSKSGNLLASAHRMARLSILMDVITGFSQTSGYADTLIINTGYTIKVIDPASLINEIYGEKFIKGYNEKDLGDTAHNILKSIKAMKSPGRTKVYYGNIQAYLAAKKVSVMMNPDLIS